MIIDVLDGHISSDSDDSEIDNYFNNNDSDTELEELEQENEKKEEIIVGIDLGTTNSCVAIWRNRKLEIIPDLNGNRTMPSIVSFTNKTKYVGKSAKNQMSLNPENTYYEVKRLIGRKYDDISVENDIPYLTYDVDKDEDNNIVIKSKLSNRKGEYTPEEISGMVLTELKLISEHYLKKPVDKVVVTVPAYFNDAQRQATKDAITIAGLECARIINEPTAAALAYGLEKTSINDKTDLNVIVYDLGGGTLDVSLLNICDGVFEVLASTGNTHLGGTDFDNRLMSHSINYFKKKHKIEKLDNLSLISLQKLKKSCENAKKILSTTWKTIIAVKDFYDGKNLYLPITKTEFNTLCQDLFILCLKPVEDVLTSCDMSREDIDEIILVGGGTRMTTIRENLKLFFRGKEPNSNVNPDEVVAAGAAIQGFILANESDPFSENIVLLDIIPLSLGVETIGGVMNVLIPRNSVIPIRRKRKYTTDSDNESSVKIKIYEGERTMTKDNFFVGEFELQGLEPEQRGIAEIEITFSIDINGIISITAEDLKNNDNKNSITITGNKGRLGVDKIKQLIKEAEEMEREDRVEKEKKQFYYSVEDLCNNILTNIKDEEYKLKEKDKELIEEDINKVLEWLEEKNYLERRKKEYIKVLERVKKKYGTLILRTTNELENIKGTVDNTNMTATSIFENEEDNDDVYEKLENEELGITDTMEEDDINELKQLRDNVLELCYSLFDIIKSDSLKISEENKSEIKDYIDDIVLWIHVQEKISKTEYKQKIDEINKACEDILSKYEEEELFENEKVGIHIERDRLEKLCYALKSSIMSNVFSVKEDIIKELDDYINETFDWLINLDLEIRKAELENTEYKLEETIFTERIDNINNLCNNIYENMTSISSERMEQDILGETEIKEDGLDNIIIPIPKDTSRNGISIFELEQLEKEQ